MTDPITLAKRRMQAATATLAIARDNKRRTELADDDAAVALARAARAAKAVKQLLDFPLMPQPGDSIEQHAKCLETAYATVILAALNEEAANA